MSLKFTVPVAAVAALLLLGGCANGTATGTTSTASTESQSGGAAGQPSDGGPGGGGGVTGTIAAVTGALLQVQSTDSQTAVTYTDATVITQTVAATLDQVTVGSCIVATSPAATDGSADATAAATGATATATATATTVRITAAVDGACVTGFGGGAIPGGSARGDRPTDGAPPGGSGGALPGGSGQRASGLVTAVSGTTITVQVTDQDGTSSTETVQVAAADAATPTTYTSTVAADAAAIVVGLCATAQGTTDDSGQMAATALTLSVAGADGCTQETGTRGGTGRGPAGRAAANG